MHEDTYVDICFLPCFKNDQIIQALRKYKDKKRFQKISSVSKLFNVIPSKNYYTYSYHNFIFFIFFFILSLPSPYPLTRSHFVPKTVHNISKIRKQLRLVGLQKCTITLGSFFSFLFKP